MSIGTENERGDYMKIFTSYFYQIRFFKSYMIPLSTACSDPRWYHDGCGNKDIVFYDKNNVINGLRILPLVPDSTCSNLCRGREYCDTVEPSSCAFLQAYYKQLQSIDFTKFMDSLTEHISSVCKMAWIDVEPFVVFIVHEAINNPCSERSIIQRWFADNGVIVEELNPKDY